MNQKSFILIIFLLNIIACAMSKIDTFKDPEFANKTYENFMIFASFDDLSSIKIVENTFCSGLKENGISCIPSIQILLPTRKYKTEEIQRILKDNNIDAVLIVSLKDIYKEQKYIPGESKTNCFTDPSGDVDCYTRSSPGHYVSKPRIKCELTLIDVKKNKNIWLATSFTAGNAYADFETMINSLAKKSIIKLAEDGLIQISTEKNSQKDLIK